MGLFKKRSGMIDLTDMHKRGMIKVPARKTSELKAGKDGFIELKPKHLSSPATSLVQTSSKTSEPQKSSIGSFFGFFDKPTPRASTPQSFSSSEPTPASANSFSTEENGYSKREVDEKIEELDNKLYRFEQRIDVLERKAGVGAGGNLSSTNW